MCSNVVLLFYSGILPCYCYYSHANKSCYYAQIMLISWLTKHLELEGGQTSLPLMSISPRTSSSLLSLMVRMLLSWCWSSLLWVHQLTRSNFCSHVMICACACYNSGIMLKCFLLAIILIFLVSPDNIPVADIVKIHSLEASAGTIL